MDLEQSAQIEEVRLVLRYAAQTLTDRQRECLHGFLMGESLAETGRRLGIIRQAVLAHRKVALEKLRDRLRSLGIQKSADLLSCADINKSKQKQILPGSRQKVRKPRLDITQGKCKHGHKRALYARRRPSGKIYCLGCRAEQSKTPEGRKAQREAMQRWRAKSRVNSDT